MKVMALWIAFLGMVALGADARRVIAGYRPIYYDGFQVFDWPDNGSLKYEYRKLLNTPEDLSSIRTGGSVCGISNRKLYCGGSVPVLGGLTVDDVFTLNIQYADYNSTYRNLVRVGNQLKIFGSYYALKDFPLPPGFSPDQPWYATSSVSQPEIYYVAEGFLRKATYGYTGRISDDKEVWELEGHEKLYPVEGVVKIVPAATVVTKKQVIIGGKVVFEGAFTDTAGFSSWALGTPVLTTNKVIWTGHDKPKREFVVPSGGTALTWLGEEKVCVSYRIGFRCYESDGTDITSRYALRPEWWRTDSMVDFPSVLSLVYLNRPQGDLSAEVVFSLIESLRSVPRETNTLLYAAKVYSPLFQNWSDGPKIQKLFQDLTKQMDSAGEVEETAALKKMRVALLREFLAMIRRTGLHPVSLGASIEQMVETLKSAEDAAKLSHSIEAIYSELDLQPFLKQYILIQRKILHGK